MTQPIDINPSSSQSPELDMAYLQTLIRQQAERSPLYENAAIIGCGYVGMTLAEYWQQRGHVVTGTTTSDRRIPQLRAVTSRAVVAAGNDFDAMRSLVQDQDTVVVCVAPTGVQAVDAGVYARTYIETAETLTRSLSQSSRVKQLVYLSSCSVYGDRRGEWVDESTRPTFSEGRSRILQEAEDILLQATNNDSYRTCILRLGGIYGPGRELVRMFAGLAGQTLPGKGDRVTNWIHLDDIVGAIEFARAHQLQGIYNLVDDGKLPLRQLVELVCDRYGLPNARWDVSRAASTRRSSLRVSNQKLKDAGFHFVHPQILA
ncbi:MAG: SDR family oxidoreductase [Cyanobacteria bacterium P01_F01_bin.33]